MAYIIGFLFFVVGIAAGFFFFFSLRQTTQMIIAGGAIWRIGLLYILRFAFAGIIFYAAARTGLPEVLLAVTGFTLARMIILRDKKAL